MGMYIQKKKHNNIMKQFFQATHGYYLTFFGPYSEHCHGLLTIVRRCIKSDKMDIVSVGNCRNASDWL